MATKPLFGVKILIVTFLLKQQPLPNLCKRFRRIADRYVRRYLTKEHGN
jgi:hypothetical protein